MNSTAELQRLSVGTHHEISEEFTLPDYLPEIRRIVSYSGNVIPESRYVDSDEIVLSGLAVANVYYIGDDGKLCAFPVNSEYSAHVSTVGNSVSDISAESMTVKTTLDSISCRATGPRRLSLCFKMRSNVFASRADELPFELSFSDGADCSVADRLSLEKRNAPFEYTAITCASATGNVSGSLHEREGTRILSCEGAAAVSSATVDSSDVTLTGDVFISCLAEDADGAYYTVRAREPFRHVIHINDGTASNVKCYAIGHVRCASVKISGGEGGEFSWESEYDAEVSVLSDREGMLIDDAYSTAYESETQASSAPVVRCLAGTDTRLSVNSSKLLAGCAGKEVIFMTSRVSRDRAECTAEGKLVLSGSCTVCAVLADDDEITTEELTLPYRFESECKKPLGVNPTVLWEVNVISTEGRLDSERLSVSCELFFSALALDSADKSYVGRAILRRDEPIVAEGEILRLYFPTEGESLWSIGKRYRCRLQSISELEDSTAVLIRAK